MIVARVLSNYSQAMADLKACSPGQRYVKGVFLILPVMLNSACNYSRGVLVWRGGGQGGGLGGAIESQEQRCSALSALSQLKLTVQGFDL